MESGTSSSRNLGVPAGRTEAGQVYVIFGQTSFAATFDLASLNGSNGFTVNGKTRTTASEIYSRNCWRRQRRQRRRCLDFGVRLCWSRRRDTSAAPTSSSARTSTAGPFPAILEVSTLNGSNGFVMYGVTADDYAGIAPVQPVTSTGTATMT